MDGKKKALIITNGALTDPVLIMNIVKDGFGSKGDYTVICVDGGADNASILGLVPDMIIGDMDSIDKDKLGEYKDKSHNIDIVYALPDKDESDTQLALDHAVTKGYSNIMIAGAIGNRIDHSFANLVLLSSPLYKDVNIRIITGNSEVFIIRESTVIHGKKGKLISIFSLSPHTFFIKTSGLEYKLENEKLLFSPVRGLSNVFTGDNAEIDIKEGTLMIVQEL